MYPCEYTCTSSDTLETTTSITAVRPSMRTPSVSSSGPAWNQSYECVAMPPPAPSTSTSAISDSTKETPIARMLR